MSESVIWNEKKMEEHRTDHVQHAEHEKTPNWCLLPFLPKAFVKHKKFNRERVPKNLPLLLFQMKKFAGGDDVLN